MTAPTNETKPPEAPAPRRLRAGQVVTFRHPDPLTGADLTGHALVLRVPADPEAAVTLAPLGLYHLQVTPDSVTAVKPDDVPTTVPQPEPEPDGS